MATRRRTARTTEDGRLPDDSPLFGLPGGAEGDEDAGALGDDPQPTKRRPGRPRKDESAGNKGVIAARGPDGKILSDAALANKVRSELYTWASMLLVAYEFKDPHCAGLFTEQVDLPNGKTQERLSLIVDRLVAIVSRHKPTMVFLAKSGVVGEFAMLGAALSPVVKAMWAAHGPTGHGHQEEKHDADLSSYPGLSHHPGYAVTG